MKILFDLFPLLVFFAAFKFYDIFVATAVAIIATFFQLGVVYWRTRRFEKMHLITLVMISVFGGLTILLHDDSFIKWKPTIVNWLFAVIIIGMTLFSKKSALEHIMAGQISLPKHVWLKLNYAWALFFTALGILNLYIAFYYNLDAPAEQRTAFWVNFKVFGIMILTIMFLILQVTFIHKYIVQNEKEEN